MKNNSTRWDFQNVVYKKGGVVGINRKDVQLFLIKMDQVQKLTNVSG